MIDAAKRAFDVGVSLALLVLALPILLVAALAIRLEDRGPLLYRQERVGRNGVAFTLSEVPQHARRRRSRRRAAMGGEARSAHHARAARSCASSASTSCRSS